MSEGEIQGVLKEIVERIASRFDPDQVILFGSRAKGTADADSDADLLIVMRVSGSKRKQAVQVDLALAGIPIPTDVIVMTPEDIEKYRDCPGTIVQEALREGKTIYERAA